jgi:hypothetical protein
VSCFSGRNKSFTQVTVARFSNKARIGDKRTRSGIKQCCVHGRVAADDDDHARERELIYARKSRPAGDAACCFSGRNKKSLYLRRKVHGIQPERHDH